MNVTIEPVLMGAVAMASLVASVFFAKFWTKTGDRLFFYFCLAFAVDALTRSILAVTPVSSEEEPLYYMGRLLTFALIAAAIVQKNKRSGAR
jgi:hypothetical protein